MYYNICFTFKVLLQYYKLLFVKLVSQLTIILYNFIHVYKDECLEHAWYNVFREKQLTVLYNGKEKLKLFQSVSWNWVLNESMLFVTEFYRWIEYRRNWIIL